MSIRKANKLVNPQGFRIRRVAGETVLFHPRGGSTVHHSPKEAVLISQQFVLPAWTNEQEVA